MVLACVDRALPRIGLQDFLLLLNAGGVAAERVDVGVAIVRIAVVRGEAALVAVNVGVTARPIDMVVDGLARATLTSSARDMLSAHLGHGGAHPTPTHGTGWVVHFSETSAIPTDVRVSTCAVCVVDLGTTCTCQNAHLPLSRSQVQNAIILFIYISINIYNIICRRQLRLSQMSGKQISQNQCEKLFAQIFLSPPTSL